MEVVKVMARDMTQRQFAEALRRNGFEQLNGGLMVYYFKDTTGVAPGAVFGATVDPDTMNILRRATVARLLRDRKKQTAQK